MASTTFVDNETVIQASWLNDVNAAVYTPGAVTAANIGNVPAGNIAATNVQTAINELDTEKQPLDAELTALATSTAAANKVPYYTSGTTAGTLDWNSATTLAASATTISSNTVIKTAIDDLIVNCSSATPSITADSFVFEDATDNTQKKALLSTLFTPRFTSGEIAITATTVHAVSHSVGSIPVLWKVVLRCKTAEFGYAIGDEVEPFFDSNATNDGLTAYVDATNIGVVVRSTIYVAQRTATIGDLQPITFGNWVLVLRVWA